MFVELPASIGWSTEDTQAVWVNTDHIVTFDRSIGPGLTLVQLSGAHEPLVIALAPAEVAQRLR